MASTLDPGQQGQGQQSGRVRAERRDLAAQDAVEEDEHLMASYDNDLGDVSCQPALGAVV
jgi:hypothetical protein